MSSVPCERCGEPQRTVEITSFGDHGPRFLPTGCPCPYSWRCCPFCAAHLDATDRCGNVDCFMWMTCIPVPDIRWSDGRT